MVWNIHVDGGLSVGDNLSQLLPDIREGNGLPIEVAFLNGVDRLEEGIQFYQVVSDRLFAFLNQVFLIMFNFKSWTRCKKV